MYAILRHGGHQHRVSPGDRLVVDRLDAEVGAVLALEPLLFLRRDGDDPGTTDAGGARLAATVIAHRRGRKLRVFKYKPKKRYRRTMGHRSELTELRIEALVARGEPLPKPAARARKAAAAAPAAELPKGPTPRAESAHPAARRSAPRGATADTAPARSPRRRGDAARGEPAEPAEPADGS